MRYHDDTEIIWSRMRRMKLNHDQNCDFCSGSFEHWASAV